MAPLGAPYSSKNANYVSPFLGAVLMFPVGAYMGLKARPWMWEVPLCVGALSCAIVGIGHWTGTIPLFAFERQVAGRSLAGVELNFGFAGLISARGDYGMWAIGGAMVLSRWMHGGHRVLRAACVAGYLVLAMGLLMTLSRTSWIAFTFYSFGAILLLSITSPQIPLRRYERLWRLGTMLILGISAVLVSGLLQRVFDSLIAMQPISYSVRVEGFDLALNVIRSSPLFGVGVSLEAIGVNYHSVIHNTFLFTLVSFGAPALVLFVWIIAIPVYRTICVALRSRSALDRANAALWIAAVSSILIQMAMFSGMTSKFFWVLLGLLGGESLFLWYNRRPNARFSVSAGQ
jgi:hypothetical protein